MEIKKGRKVIALDVSGKPESIKTQDWLVEGNEYTVVKIVKAKIQNKLGFVLEEIQTNDPLFFGYDIARFGISLNEVERMIINKEIEVEERVLEKV